MGFLACGGRLSSIAFKGAPSYPAATPRGGVSPWKTRTKTQPSPRKHHHRFHHHTSRRRSQTHSGQLARRWERSANTPAPNATERKEEEEAQDEFHVAAAAAAFLQPSDPSLSVSGVSGGAATESPRAGLPQSSCTSPRLSSPAAEATVAGPLRSSRPPTPPSILIGRSELSPVESFACRRFPSTPPPTPCSSLRTPVPPLSVDQAHALVLNVKNVRMSAERRNLLEQQQMYHSQPQQQQQLEEGQRSPALVSPASLRSAGSTSHSTNGIVVHTVGDNAATAATEASSCCTSRGGSARFVHTREDTAKVVAATAAFLCAGVSTPRNRTPLYRNAEVGKPSGSLLLDQPSLFSNEADTSSTYYKDATAAAAASEEEEGKGVEGAERDPGFVPISFAPSSREGKAARCCRSSTSGALLHSLSGGLSPSDPSFPSPASILKSAAILSPTSNGATIDTTTTTAASSTSRPFHPSWSTLERSGSRTGCRRGRCECPSGAPERCRHASSFCPHFVEEDSSQRQLSRHDSRTSSSSDDKRTLEVVRSTIQRIHQRDSATGNQSGPELPSVMRKRVAGTPRRKEEQAHESNNPLRLSG